MAGSFEAPKTGDHFGLLLNDDPHNETNISTIDQIEKVKEGWKALGPLGDGERTRRVYVATRWHFADVNDLIMQKRAPLFYKKFIDKALLHNHPLANIEMDDKCAVFLLDVWANEGKTQVLWPEKEPVENIKDYRDQWGSYLDQACGEDQELRRNVEVLLDAHVSGESLLDKGAIAGGATKIEEFAAYIYIAICRNGYSINPSIHRAARPNGGPGIS